MSLMVMSRGRRNIGMMLLMTTTMVMMVMRLIWKIIFIKRVTMMRVNVSADDCDDDCDDDTDDDDDDDDDDDGVVVVVIAMNTQTSILLPAKRAEKYREEHNEVVI